MSRCMKLFECTYSIRDICKKQGVLTKQGVQTSACAHSSDMQQEGYLKATWHLTHTGVASRGSHIAFQSMHFTTISMHEVDEPRSLSL